MGKAKRLKKERAEMPQDTPVIEQPRHPKWYYTVYRLMMVFIGCLALTLIAASLTPAGNKSVWPGLLTMASWLVWIVYVFKIMKIKD